MTDWLTVDIGNSALKAARFDGERIIASCRIPLEDGTCDLDDEFAVFLDRAPFRRSAVCSVVPGLSSGVGSRLSARGPSPIVVGPDLDLPFRLGYETPGTLGSDRLAAAAGAWMWAQEARADVGLVLAVDAGTALNVEVVIVTDQGPVYLGGVIAAGPDLLRRALHSGTAQLPHVPVEWPGTVIGRTTAEAIQAGLLPGFVAAVDGIVQQIEQECGCRAITVATGGWAALIAERLPRIDRVAPHLVHEGVRTIAAANV